MLKASTNNPLINHIYGAVAEIARRVNGFRDVDIVREIVYLYSLLEDVV